MLSARLAFSLDPRRVRSFDGTEIAYHVTGAPHPGAPWVVLASGLGGSHLPWRGPIDYLRDRYRFVTWDYRGLYASERPRPERPGAYALGAHVRDLEAIMSAEGIERAGVAGWSVGVQVALEAFRRLPGRVRNLVLLNGVWGRPLGFRLRLPGAGAAMPGLVELVRRVHAIGASPAHAQDRARGRRDAFWLKRLGLAGRALDEAVLADLATAAGSLDLDAFLRNLRAFAEHDAGAALATIDVPVLVVAGDLDPLVPPGIAQQMARRIAEAELFVVRGGAHMTPLEHPELVSLRIERFYRDHGF
jgi:pimeloyl-ACP methyl ester carboxylesterase